MYKLKTLHNIYKKNTIWVNITDGATHTDKTQLGCKRGRLRHSGYDRPKRIEEATFEEDLLIIYSQWWNTRWTKQSFWIQENN